MPVQAEGRVQYLNGNIPEVTLRTKLRSFSYWLVPQQIHFQKFPSPLKEADAVSAKEPVLFGAGILRLFRLTHLRAFVSLSLARS